MSEIERTVLVERVDGVATITLNRPHRKNGVTTSSVEEFIAALASVEANHRDRVLILTGAGGAFCSGMDLAEPMLPDELTFMRRIAVICTTLHDLPIPTIAKVRGPAVGFGANLALCCDLAVAAEDAMFGELFADRGLSLDGGGSWSLPRLLGPQKAKEIAFFGARISGTEAAAIGMVNRAVPESALDGEVAAWAARLAAGPRRALSAMKAQLNKAYETSFAAALESEAVAQAMCARSPEVKEGVAAFMEKRAPDFRSVDKA
ncbi:MAG: enoyl-CoA hydratase/isomerase family protein [Sporichthyaceae bacterium]